MIWGQHTEFSHLFSLVLWMMISVGVHFYLGSGWGWGGGGFFTLLPREFFMPRVVGLGGGLMFPYVAPEFVGGCSMLQSHALKSSLWNWSILLKTDCPFVHHHCRLANCCVLDERAEVPNCVEQKRSFSLIWSFTPGRVGEIWFPLDRIFHIPCIHNAIVIAIHSPFIQWWFSPFVFRNPGRPHHPFLQQLESYVVWSCHCYIVVSVVVAAVLIVATIIVSAINEVRIAFIAVIVTIFMSLAPSYSIPVNALIPWGPCSLYILPVSSAMGPPCSFPWCIHDFATKSFGHCFHQSFAFAIPFCSHFCNFAFAKS